MTVRFTKDTLVTVAIVAFIAGVLVGSKIIGPILGLT